MRQNVSSKRLQAEAMSEGHDMQKKLNTKLQDLLKTEHNSLAKLQGMLETLTRQKNVLSASRQNQYNVCNEK